MAAILVAATSSAGTSMLSATSEYGVLGGSSCNDALEGFAVGMGLATLLGCWWCAGGAIGAKIAELLFC